MHSGNKYMELTEPAGFLSNWRRCLATFSLRYVGMTIFGVLVSSRAVSCDWITRIGNSSSASTKIAENVISKTKGGWNV